MEEIVERENIFTIPNLLCVTRSFLAPYIGYVIVQEQYQLAIGLLIFAGLTDLVGIFYENIYNSLLILTFKDLRFQILKYNN